MPRGASVLAFACMLASCQSSHGLSTQFAPAPATATHHTLMPSPTTVAWGYYWSEAKPVLRINSGDEVTVGTLLTNSPTRLTQNGVDSSAVEQSLKDIYRDV